MPDPNDSNDSQDFYTRFQATRDDFTARLSTATAPQVSELSAQLALLRTQFLGARPFLPPYDQRQYEMQLKSWEQVLEKLQTNQNSAGTRPKFSFKRKDKSETPRSDAPKVEASIPAETMNRSPTTHLPLTYKSECFLSLASFPNTSIPTGSELIITNLNDCVVDLMDNSGATMSPRAVHIRDVSNCVILLPAIEGSVLLYDLLRCVVVISGYHQFRMHRSERVHVYLPAASKLVIEKCVGIDFSEYPASPLGSADGPENKFRVEDFSHIRPTPSPNWCTRNDTTASLDHWLQKLGDRGRSASGMDLGMLDEILPHAADEGSGCKSIISPSNRQEFELTDSTDRDRGVVADGQCD